MHSCRHFGRLLQENHEDLAQVSFISFEFLQWKLMKVQIITVENGKPITDARGEVTYGC